MPHLAVQTKNSNSKMVRVLMKELGADPLVEGE